MQLVLHEFGQKSILTFGQSNVGDHLFEESTQFTAQSSPQSGIVDCMRKMYRTEGVLSFWKGILPPIMAETPKRAWKFFTFEQFKVLFKFSKDQAREI